MADAVIERIAEQLTLSGSCVFDWIDAAYMARLSHIIAIGHREAVRLGNEVAFDKLVASYVKVGRSFESEDDLAFWLRDLPDAFRLRLKAIGLWPERFDQREVS